MREVLPDLDVFLDGHPISASTTVCAAGSDVIVFTTAIPDFAVTLTSCCVITAGGASVAITQRRVSPRTGDQVDHREVDSERAAALTLAGACLLEHTEDARHLLLSHAETGARATVTVGDRALDRAAAGWGSTLHERPDPREPWRVWRGTGDVRTYNLPTELVTELDDYTRGAGVKKSDVIAAGLLSLLDLEPAERLDVVERVERAKFSARRRI